MNLLHDFKIGKITQKEFLILTSPLDRFKTDVTIYILEIPEPLQLWCNK